jgi:hypothetical protein
MASEERPQPKRERLELNEPTSIGGDLGRRGGAPRPSAGCAAAPRGRPPPPACRRRRLRCHRQHARLPARLAAPERSLLVKPPVRPDISSVPRSGGEPALGALRRVPVPLRKRRPNGAPLARRPSEAALASRKGSCIGILWHLIAERGRPPCVTPAHPSSSRSAHSALQTHAPQCLGASRTSCPAWRRPTSSSSSSCRRVALARPPPQGTPRPARRSAPRVGRGARGGARLCAAPRAPAAEARAARPSLAARPRAAQSGEASPGDVNIEAVEEGEGAQVIEMVRGARVAYAFRGGD